MSGDFQVGQKVVRFLASPTDWPTPDEKKHTGATHRHPLPSRSKKAHRPANSRGRTDYPQAPMRNPASCEPDRSRRVSPRPRAERLPSEISVS